MSRPGGRLRELRKNGAKFCHVGMCQCCNSLLSSTLHSIICQVVAYIVPKVDLLLTGFCSRRGSFMSSRKQHLEILFAIFQ